MGGECNEYGVEDRRMQGWGKSVGKRSLERSRRRWENSIKMYLHEAGCGGMDWTEVAQDRNICRAHVYAVMKLVVP